MPKMTKTEKRSRLENKQKHTQRAREDLFCILESSFVEKRHVGNCKSRMQARCLSLEKRVLAAEALKNSRHRHRPTPLKKRPVRSSATGCHCPTKS